MTITSKDRGNEIEFKDNEWFYKDTVLKVSETYKNKPCGYCGKKATREGHDACLGTLIGLMNACCGHGEEGSAYVQFLDGKCIRGKDAKTIIEVLKKHNKN